MNAFKRVSFDALGHVHKYIFNTDLSKQKYWRWAIHALASRQPQKVAEKFVR